MYIVFHILLRLFFFLAFLILYRHCIFQDGQIKRIIIIIITLSHEGLCLDIFSLQNALILLFKVLRHFLMDIIDRTF